MAEKRNIPPLTVVLDRLRSAHNAGNIFRLADAVGSCRIYCCGYTPAPPHPKLEKTAMGADKTVEFRTFPDACSAIEDLKKEGVENVLAVETLPDAEDVLEKNYAFPLALVFGNEALGIDAKAVEMCTGSVKLPMFGNKTSINVGNCAAVAMYAAMRCFRRHDPEKGVEK